MSLRHLRKVEATQDFGLGNVDEESSDEEPQPVKKNAFAGFCMSESEEE